MAATTRDQQKDLIREVLREQAAAAAASGGQRTSKPPTKKASLVLPGPDWPSSMAFHREYGFSIAGECDYCGEPRFVSINLAACCGCDRFLTMQPLRHSASAARRRHQQRR